VNFSPPDFGDRGAAVGVAGAIADPLDTHGAFGGDDGRLPTGTSARLEGAFKTPMLRCVSLRLRFMHTGQLCTLSDVVAFLIAAATGPRPGQTSSVRSGSPPANARTS
jgi:cytochrome c peroxidase